MADTRQYEIQIVEAVRSIAKVLAGGSISGVSGAASSSSSSISGTTAALDQISAKLDSISGKLNKLVTKLSDALFYEVPPEEDPDAPVGSSASEEEEPEYIGLATLMQQQNEVIEKIRDAVFDDSGEDIVSALTELTSIKEALDGTTLEGVSARLAAIGTNTAAVAGNVQAGDADIASAITGSPRPLPAVIIYGTVSGTAFTQNAGQPSLSSAISSYVGGALVYLRYVNGSSTEVVDMVTYCEEQTPLLRTNGGIEWTS